MRLISLALVLLLIFPLGMTEGAQRKAAPAPKATSRYVNEPFDLTVKALPIGYAGADIEAIYKSLEERSEGEKKGEFETTEEFKARVSASRQRPLVGKIFAESLIGVTLESIGTAYDADAKTMRVGVELDHVWDGVELDEATKSLTSKRVFRPTKTYEASNAYGAKAIVEENTSYHYELRVTNHPDFSPKRREQYGEPEITIEIPMDVPEARTAKSNLRALAVFKLQPPLISQGYLRSKPTITNPKDIFAIYQYLVCELRAIIIYNVATGQIYATGKKI